MATIRTWHFYIGMLIAPSVLFFAVTGALQLFSLHEAHGAYTPPSIIVKLSSVHKDQVFKAGHHHDHAKPKAEAPDADAGQPAKHDDDDHKMKTSTLILKIFFFWVVAGGLTVSTLFGIWIGVTHPKRRRAAWILLALGAVIPAALLII
jgi:hypothetical protein